MLSLQLKLINYMMKNITSAPLFSIFKVYNQAFSIMSDDQQITPL